MLNLVLIAVLRFLPLLLLLVFAGGVVLVLTGELLSRRVVREATSYYLVVKKNLTGTGPPAGERWLIDEKISIGRAPQNDVVIDVPYVSAWHAQLERKGDRFWLQDLNSTNGTLVNGRSIRGKTQIKCQDSVAIGGVFLGVERGEMDAGCSANPRRLSQAAE